MLPEQGHSGVQLSRRNSIGAGENNGGSGFHLVVIEFSKVLHVDLDLARIHNRNGIAQLYIFIGHFLHSGNHIGKLANAGRLNDNTVRVVLRNHLVKCLAEIAHQAAANAAGVHFRDINAGILQKAAVNANFAKFIFDEHQFFAGVGFLDHLFD